MEDLNNLRNQIDKVDEDLVKAFEERMKIVEKVAEYKKQNNIPILNSNREEQVIHKNVKRLKDIKYKDALKEFMEDVMNISKAHQDTVISDKDCICAFQGVEGSFSEQALEEFFGKGIKKCSVKNFEDIFNALNDNKITYGVLPIENSSTGGISDVYDLIKQYGFYINGEKIIKVDHNLLAVKGAEIQDIEEVYSHSQGLSQCCKFLNNYPQWKLIPYVNTAVSAEYVKECNAKSKAAVASKRAAKIYGLNILKENINYNDNNYTRFIIVGRKPEINKDCNKVSIVLSIAHKAGSLYNILKHFSINNLNLLKIESRPILDKPWEYFFYMDFEGNLEEEATKNVVEIVKKNCSYFKVLGNYKSDK